MPKDKDRKRLVRRRMLETGERYTTARDRLVGRSAEPLDRLDPRDREQIDRLDRLVQQLADKRLRISAMVELVGGVTASDLRHIDPLPADTLEALVRGLRDPHPPVRWWCIQLLDHVADERAIQAVVPLLDDPVDRVRRNAVHALGCVACKPSASAALPGDLLERIATIARTDPNRKVRGEAAHALACRLRASGTRSCGS